MTFSGFVQSYGGLLAVRFLLGVTEYAYPFSFHQQKCLS